MRKGVMLAAVLITVTGRNQRCGRPPMEETVSGAILEVGPGNAKGMRLPRRQRQYLQSSVIYSTYSRP